MAAYYAALAGITLLGACLCFKNRSRIKDTFFIFASFVLLAGMSAVRYAVGYDYSYVYMPQYEQVLLNPDFSFKDTRFEPGFFLLEKGTAFFSLNFQLLFAVTAILTVGLFMLYYRLYSPNVYISVFLFIAMSHYYCSMNFIRQSLAGIISIFAVESFKRKRFVRYFVVVALASLFHQSALILIPFFFINLIPVNKKYVLPVYLTVTAAVYFNTHRIMGLVTRYWYKGYSPQSVHVYTTFEWPYTIVALTAFLAVYLGAGILNKSCARNYIYVNYAFFAFFFTLMGTRHGILDRLGIYFEFAFPVSIAMVLCGLKSELSKSEARKKSYAAYAFLLAGVFGGGLLYHQYALVKDHHGVVPYCVVFNQPFYTEYATLVRNTPRELIIGFGDGTEENMVNDATDQ